MDFEVPQNPEFEMGGDGLYGTAGDYLKFVRMKLNNGNGNQVLRPETVTLMSRNAMGNVKVENLKANMPALTHDAEFFPGMDKRWGLFFMFNNTQAPTGRTVLCRSQGAAVVLCLRVGGLLRPSVVGRGGARPPPFSNITD